VGIERGLIGPREGERIWDRHIENCLPVTTLIPDKGSLVDIGSGAGLPGIVIALAKPSLKVTLIEPLRRRVEFLFEVIDRLNLKIEVIRGKSEAIVGQYDRVTARAVAPLPRLMEISWHLVKPGGSLLAIKGESAASELAATPLKGVAKNQLHEIKLEDLPVSRVVELVKAG
jgi:16S rRNA (guanine527-N7)-methyltransferase